MHLLVVLLITSIGAPPRGPAADATPQTISTWLCGVLGTGQPGARLNTFPGSGGGSVSYATRSGAVRLPRSGRVIGEDVVQHIWTYAAGPHTVSYRYRVKPSGRGVPYGFEVRIETRSAGGRPAALIFESVDEVVSWLTPLGSVHRSTEDPERFVARHWSTTYGDWGWEVTVDLLEQTVSVNWQSEEDLRAEAFCSHR